MTQISDAMRAELLAELFTRIENIAGPDPIPVGWFTLDEYYQQQEAKGISHEKVRRQLYAAHKAGLLGRCQKQGHMWYYEKESV